MREFTGGRRVSDVEYIVLWLGLVGGCVGLHVPKEVALDLVDEAQEG